MTVRTKPAPRAYRSSLRDAQAAQTRERILAAAKEFLEANDLADLTLRRVAELADVSAPTVYAHFPTMEALHQAFFFWLKPYIGTDNLAAPSLSDFVALPHRMFSHYQRQGRLLRNLLNTPAWDRLRADDWQEKEEVWTAPIAAALPGLTPAQTRRAAIALSAFSTGNVWRWLIDITGCSEAEAEQIAEWATAALVSALERDASGLASADSGTPRNTMSRKKGNEK
jgi:AcrR family transcriptional regulator